MDVCNLLRAQDTTTCGLEQRNRLGDGIDERGERPLVAARRVVRRDPEDLQLANDLDRKSVLEIPWRRNVLSDVHLPGVQILGSLGFQVDPPAGSTPSSALWAAFLAASGECHSAVLFSRSKYFSRLLSWAEDDELQPIGEPRPTAPFRGRLRITSHQLELVSGIEAGSYVVKHHEARHAMVTGLLRPGISMRPPRSGSFRIAEPARSGPR